MVFESTQVLTWIMTFVGLTGFLFVGKKKWWAWYINLGCQILWAVYAFVTGQPAFLVSVAVYSVIFGINAYKWTKDHRNTKQFKKAVTELKVGEGFDHNGVKITRNPDPISADEYREKHFKQAIPLIAEVCHEANRVLQLANEEEASPPWREAADWQKDSAIQGVKAALEGQTPEELHASWYNSKVADGWVYGEFKDGDFKTHPCLVPYAKLPEAQQVKDHMFYAIVKSFKLQQQYAHVSQG